MKNISTGTGLCVLGLCVVAYPIVDRLAPDRIAHAGAPVASVAKTAMVQVEPTIVWFGVSTIDYETLYHRLWSDGRIEIRRIGTIFSAPNCSMLFTACDWTEVPPPPAGSGFACRADLNGDRMVDGADLGMILGAWGHHVGCPPEPTYPCFDFASGGMR